MVMDKHTRSVRPTPLQSARSMELSALVVECDLVVYFIIYFFINEIILSFYYMLSVYDRGNH